MNDQVVSFAYGLMKALLGEQPAPRKIARRKRAAKPEQLTLGAIHEQVSKKLAEERAEQAKTPSIQSLDEMFNLKGPDVPDGYYRPSAKYTDG